MSTPCGEIYQNLHIVHVNSYFHELHMSFIILFDHDYATQKFVILLTNMSRNLRGGDFTEKVIIFAVQSFR